MDGPREKENPPGVHEPGSSICTCAVALQYDTRERERDDVERERGGRERGCKVQWPRL